jgi:hypothetical protein
VKIYELEKKGFKNQCRLTILDSGVRLDPIPGRVWEVIGVIVYAKGSRYGANEERCPG